MKNLFLFILTLLIGCSSTKKSVYSTVGRCSLFLSEDDGVAREISMTDLPNTEGVMDQESLWCHEKTLSGAKEFEVYNEKWVVVFHAGQKLFVKVYPYGNEIHARSRIEQFAIDRQGCDLIQRAADLFNFPELFSKEGKKFSLKMSCTINTAT